MIFIIIIARFGFAERTCFETSVTVAQISEFSLIFAAMGVSLGLVGGEVLAVVGVVGLVTIVCSAYLILYSARLYAWIQTRGLLRVSRARPGEDLEPAPAHLTDHVLIVGMSDLGRRLVQRLHARGVATLALDSDPGKLAGLPGPTLVGDVDAEATLEAAGLGRARAVISTLRIANVQALLTHRCQAAGVPIAVHGFERAVSEVLAALGPDLLYSARRSAGRWLAQQVTGAPDAAGPAPTGDLP